MDRNIKKSERRLDYLNSDSKTMDICWQRERALHEEANLISTGKHKEKINIILRSYKLGLTTEQIAQIVELNEEQVIDTLSKNNIKEIESNR